MEKRRAHVYDFQSTHYYKMWVPLLNVEDYLLTTASYAYLHHTLCASPGVVVCH